MSTDQTPFPPHAQNDGNDRPHLRYDLAQRFAAPGTVKIGENFIIHEVEDRTGTPYTVYQGLSKLQRNPEVPRRVLDHARRIGAFRDPQAHQTLEVYEPSGADPTLYIVESREGDGLDEVLAADDPSEETAIRYLRALLVALEPIHEAGMVYGTMPPANVRRVRAQAGDVLKLGGLFNVHFPGKPVGLSFDPEFNAPVSESETVSWSPADDIYVVGMIAYRMLLGSRTYAAVFAGVLESEPQDRANAWATAHRDRAPFADLSEMRPDLGPELSSFVKRMLSVDPAKRYANAHLAREALDAAMRIRDERLRRIDFPADPVARDAGGGVFIQKPPHKPWFNRLTLLGLGGVSAVVSAVLLYFLLAGPSSKDLAEVRAQRNTVFATGQEAIDAGLLALAEDHALKVAFAEVRTGFDEAEAVLLDPPRDLSSLKATYEDLQDRTDTIRSGVLDLKARAEEGAERARTLGERVTALLPAGADEAGAIAERQTALEADMAARRYDRALAFLDEALPALGERAEELEALSARVSALGEEAATRQEAARAALPANAPELAEPLALVAEAAAAADERRYPDAIAGLEAAVSRFSVLEEGAGTARADADDARDALEEAMRRREVLAPVSATGADSDDVAAEAIDEGIAPDEAAGLMAAGAAAYDARRYGEAAARFRDALAVVEKTTADLGDLRARAEGARAAFREVAADGRLKAVSRLGDAHPLRVRRDEGQAAASTAAAAFERRDWIAAATGFAEAGETLAAVAEGLDALGERARNVRAVLGDKRAELERLGGNRVTELGTIDEALAAIDAALSRAAFDDVLAQSRVLDSRLDQLIRRVPVDVEGVSRARDMMATARSAVAEGALALAPGHRLRTQFEALETERDEAERREPVETLGDAAERYRDLAERYRALVPGLAAFGDAVREQRAALSRLVGEAGALLAEGDATLAAAVEALGSADTAIGEYRLDAAESLIAKALAELRETVDAAGAAKAAASARFKDTVDRAAALFGQYGGWINALAEVQPFRENLEAVQSTLEQRDWAAATAGLDQLDGALSALSETLRALEADADAAKAAATAARQEASDHLALQTAAFEKATAAFAAGSDAMTGRVLPEARDAWREAARLYGAAIPAFDENADRIAALREMLGEHVAAAGALLAKDDSVLGEARALLSGEPEGADAGSDAVRAMHEAVAERLSSALDGARTTRDAAEAVRSGLAERHAALRAAGGEASADFGAIAEQIEAGDGAMAGKEWARALAAYRAATDLIAAIETAIAEGRVLACPATSGGRESLLVPVGTYSIGGNTRSARLARDAARLPGQPAVSDAALQTTRPFCVEATEVTVGDFRAFVESGKGAASSADWERSDPSDLVDSDVVARVTQTEAEAYAAWISEATGRTYSLPTVEQLIAATALAQRRDAPIPALANSAMDARREWTRDACRDADSRIVIGQIGADQNRVYAQCLARSERNPTIGFRLVIVK